MPASIPGSTLAQNQGNPSAGRFVNFDLLSGPKGSPLDRDQAGNVTTGALSTGIGFGCGHVISPVSDPLISNALRGIRNAGFSDDYTVGVTKPDGTAAAVSTLMYIGGGRTSSVGAITGVPFPPAPYTAGFGLGGAGNGGSRDAGAGPAFTGFLEKMVTATGAVANGAAIEAGWINRSGLGMVIDQSAFGSSTAASAVVA